MTNYAEGARESARVPAGGRHAAGGGVAGGMVEWAEAWMRENAGPLEIEERVRAKL